MSDTDLELLVRYTRQHAEDAFGEIVRRHLDLVFSAALRQVRSPQLAEEVAQSVFTDLARQAARLAPDTNLTAWLYQVTRRTAIDVVRREARRQLREQVAHELAAMNATAADWTHIEPILDEAMQALDDIDRTAVLLRYFENKSLREVGQTLGTNEDAARKRVSRAVERLHEFFTKRGVTIGASGLAVVISANAVQAAPVGLAAAFSSAALMSTVAGSGTLTLLKFMAMTKFKVGVISALVVAGVVTTVVIQNQAQARRRAADAELRQQGEQLAQSQAEQKRLLNLATQPRSPHPNTPDELEKLRAEATTPRKQADELTHLQQEERGLQALLAKARQDLYFIDTNEQETVESEELKAKREYSFNLARAMWEYASRHNDRFPTHFEQVTEFIPPEARKQTNVTSGQFVIVYQGTTTGIQKYAHPQHIMLFKERQPWKNSDGKWALVWSTLGGGGAVYSPVDGKFDAWEKQHTIPPEAQKE
jgi:RNA polymerase sigma factor (sigma-70 family)